MADREQQPIPGPTEVIFEPRPSWAPAFLAIGAAALVCGIYAEGFIVRGWVYCIIGAIFFICALVSIIHRASSDFRRLPRRQRVRGAALPAASLHSTPRR